MPTTPRYLLPYPAPGALPDIPADLLALAVAVDGKLWAIAGGLASLPAAYPPADGDVAVRDTGAGVWKSSTYEPMRVAALSAVGVTDGYVATALGGVTLWMPPAAG